MSNRLELIKSIRRKLLDRLGNVQIDIIKCKSIETTWAGKFRVIKSKLSV